MSTETHLAGYGVTMEVARDFIMSNYESNLGEVYNTCKEFGVNNDMIAEILGTVIPGVNGTIVSSFFDSAGFSGHSLGFNTDVSEPLTITKDGIRDFYVEYSDDLNMIYTTFKNSSLSNDAIAEALHSSFPGLTATIVSNFFNDKGFDGSALGFDAPVIPTFPDTTSDVVADGTYFGNFVGSQTGEISFVVTDDSVSGTWYSPSWSEFGYVNGTVNNETGSLYVTSSDEDGTPITFIGVIATESMNGTWSMPHYGEGTFSGDLVG